MSKFDEDCRSGKCQYAYYQSYMNANAVMQNGYLAFKMFSTIIYEKLWTYYIFFQRKILKIKKNVRNLLEQFTKRREKSSEIFSKEIYNEKSL